MASFFTSGIKRRNGWAKERSEEKMKGPQEAAE
jgi:hypothetical protein